jgi:succinate dehydrogenase / fumarate reductase, cytochrome b subunit
MSRSERPLSPHLGIYRWEVTMVLSILHRLSGVFLSMGVLFLAVWLSALAGGMESFALVNAFLGSMVGQALLLAWTLALFIHMGNGVRHLFWDVGLGFELDMARWSGWGVLVFAAVATAIAWWCGLGATA